jgi:hypothetical protein
MAKGVADPKAFRSGRNFSAWIGLVPKQHSSGGKDRLGSISKQGDRYLRGRFVAGALAVIHYAKIHGTRHRPWLTASLARKTGSQQGSSGTSVGHGHGTSKSTTKQAAVGRLHRSLRTISACIMPCRRGNRIATLFAAVHESAIGTKRTWSNLVAFGQERTFSRQGRPTAPSLMTHSGHRGIVAAADQAHYRSIFVRNFRIIPIAHADTGLVGFELGGGLISNITVI